MRARGRVRVTECSGVAAEVGGQLPAPLGRGGVSYERGTPVVGWRACEMVSGLRLLIIIVIVVIIVL